MVEDKRTLLASSMIIAAAILWGLIGLFTKGLTAGGLQALQITQVRSLLALLGFLVVLVLRKGKLPRVALRDLWLFLGTGVGSIALFNTLYFFTMEESTLAVASTLLYTSPVFILLMARLFFGEKLTTQKLLAVLLAILGSILITGVLGGAEKISLLALLTGLGSGFTYALYSIFGRAALKKYDIMTVITYTFLFSTLALLPFSRPAEILEMMAVAPHLLIYALLLGTVSTMAPFLLYTTSLSSIDTGKAGILACIEPVVATLISIFVFREAFGPSNALGILLVLSAVSLLNIRRRKVQRPLEEATNKRRA